MRRRPDPLLSLSLLGILLCALIATLHPNEPLDPTAPERQAGRHVQIDVTIHDARHGDGWSGGQAIPHNNDAGAQDNGTARPPITFAWVWFQPPQPPPQPGDRLQGNALVESDAHGIQLVLSGPHDALILPGPHPIPARWADIRAYPEHHLGRPLIVHARAESGHLFDPEGRPACTWRAMDAFAHDTATTLEFASIQQFVISLERTPDPLGWICKPWSSSH